MASSMRIASEPNTAHCPSAYQMPRQKSKVKTVTHQIPLYRRDTEREALTDLGILHKNSA
jgi:hypothetical protein